MQLGFVIDHSRCIGCHACTVACKSENDVPVGDFRTWVKYTEQGTFPEVKRSFAVLRCNQCSEAPCVEICPVSAMEKRTSDGIVDIDPDACIGCKACMQGCPYDAIYLNEEKGTVQKCHFCVHRTERGLAPACAVVCPTEAIVPGDFHDPDSTVSRMRGADELTARKVEAGTGPNVLYKEVTAAAIDPGQTNGSGGYLWAQQISGVQMDAELFSAMETHAKGGTHARTVYNTAHPPPWGSKITGYLFFKSLAAGVFLAGCQLLAPMQHPANVSAELAIAVPLLALLTLGATMFLLVIDLKRPERFWYIFARPNWNSWLAKGSFILAGYSVVLLSWLALGLSGRVTGGFVGGTLLLVTALGAALSAAYTGWLFAQSKGRVLWMRRGMAVHLLGQAVLAGSALLLVLAPFLELPGEHVSTLGNTLVGALAVHLFFILFEGRLAPPGREAEYLRTVRLVSHGPFARRHWAFGVAGGIVVPAVMLLALHSSLAWAIAGLLVLGGLWVEEDVTVHAGQALPIS